MYILSEPTFLLNKNGQPIEQTEDVYYECGGFGHKIREKKEHRCEYCNSKILENKTHCINCGASI